MKGVKAKATAVGDFIKACQYVGTETHKTRVSQRLSDPQNSNKKKERRIPKPVSSVSSLVTLKKIVLPMLPPLKEDTLLILLRMYAPPL